MKKVSFKKLERLTERQRLLFLFTFSLVIRLVFSFVFVQTRGVYLDADASEYIRFAKCILDQGWMVKNIEPLKDSMVGPGYPLLVALNFIISGVDHFGFLIFVQSILGASTVLVIYKLAFKISDNKLIALFSASWLSFYIQYIWYTPWVLKETVVFLLFPLSIYLSIRIKESLATFSKESLLLILSLLYLIHTDERYIVFVPLMLLFILIPFNYLNKRVITTAILLTGIIIGMTPWLYRNYMVYKKPVILTARTTVLTDKLFGYEPLWNTAGRYDHFNKRYRARPESKESIPFYKSIVDSLISGHEVSSSEVNMFGFDNIKKQVSDGNIPYSFSPYERRWSYFSSYWQPFKFKGSFYGYGYRWEAPWNLRMNIVSIIQYGIILPFFICGIYFILRKRNLTGIFLLTVILIHTFIHTFLAWGIPRYRLPIDGLIIIIATWGLFMIYNIVKRDDPEQVY